MRLWEAVQQQERRAGARDDVVQPDRAHWPTLAQNVRTRSQEQRRGLRVVLVGERRVGEEVAFARVVEDLERGLGGADRRDHGIDPLLPAHGVAEGVVDLRGHTGRPGLGAEHLEREGAGEHEHAGDVAAGGDVLRHAAAVGEAGGDEAAGQVLDRCRRTLHERRVAEALRVRGGVAVVIEDASLVLVDHLDGMAGGTQPLRGVLHAEACAEDGMEQGDLAAEIIGP